MATGGEGNEEPAQCQIHHLHALNLYCVPCQLPVCRKCAELARLKNHAVVPWTVLETLSEGNSAGQDAATPAPATVVIPPGGVSSFQKNFNITKEDLQAALKTKNPKAPSKQAKATAEQEASRGAASVAVKDVERQIEEDEESEERVQCRIHPLHTLNLYCVPCQLPVCRKCAEHAWHENHAIVPWTRAVLETLKTLNAPATRVHTWRAAINRFFVPNEMRTKKEMTKTQEMTMTKELMAKQSWHVKLALIGDSKVGKTCLTNRYCDNRFRELTQPTIRTDQKFKRIQWSPELTINMQVLDMGGDTGDMLPDGRSFVEGLWNVWNSDGYLVVFDLTDERTLGGAKHWKKYIVDDDSIPCILVGNKKDCAPLKVTEEQVARFSNDHGFHAWRFISAKTNEGVDEVFRVLLEEVLPQVQRREHDRILREVERELKNKTGEENYQ